MEYSLVFDVIQSGYRNWWFGAVGFIFVTLGALLVRFREQIATSSARTVIFPFVFFGFSVLWTLFAFTATATDYIRLSSALQEGRCDIVEGVISNFHPMPYSGHDKEWFVVGDRRFEYSDYMVTAGFNNTASHGGPLRMGLRVRVHHVGNSIARLEVAR